MRFLGGKREKKMREREGTADPDNKKGQRQGRQQIPFGMTTRKATTKAKTTAEVTGVGGGREADFSAALLTMRQ
jgi:hypothetical protein